MNTSRSLFAATAIAATAGLTACGGSSTGSAVAHVAQPRSSATAATDDPPAADAAAAATPKGFPLGSWAKTHGLYHETVYFSDAALVKLQDSRGMSTENLKFPEAGEVTFTLGDNDFCDATDSGTYKYAVTHHHLTFALVGKDKCGSRVDYLTGKPWVSMG